MANINKIKQKELSQLHCLSDFLPYIEKNITICDFDTLMQVAHSFNLSPLLQPKLHEHLYDIASNEVDLEQLKKICNQDLSNIINASLGNMHNGGHKFSRSEFDL